MPPSPSAETRAEPRPAAAPATPLLRVGGLHVTVGGGTAEAVRDVSFTVHRGESVGLVGESGSGKTLTCRSILGVLPKGCAVSAGTVDLAGVELTALTRREWDGVRGRALGAVFQDPASYLNPSITVGRQLTESLRVAAGLPKDQARTRAVELLDAVGLRDPSRVYHRYPDELSGGMLQRVLIAIAIGGEPDLLIADEATTALDVVVQAEVLDLLARLRAERGLSLLLVTHDLAVVAETCDRVLVFYAGELVESGPTEQVLRSPAHPYTEALLRVAAPGSVEVLPGRPPPTGAELPGCRFADRCPYAEDRCTARPVALRTTGDGRAARCVRVGEQP
ncbi:ABC transporter ATP-binding protein [Actinoallomurus purpureus]|uniref:ABC transporter ATP-binding protein n=1 Tax=Actinoallomurus purpureus TaxID=478114 RepID=UPI0020938DF6|nr:ABC transporter ATP-binding protein [Actinoallomurus purpureus]MCO6008095.1 ABC transporter ATP-binding protein [Actinoallomurus purpureus]